MDEQDLAKQFGASLLVSRREAVEGQRLWKIVQTCQLGPAAVGRDNYQKAFNAFIEQSPSGRAQRIARKVQITGADKLEEDREKKRFDSALQRLSDKLSEWHWNDEDGTSWTLVLRYKHSSLLCFAQQVTPAQDRGAEKMVSTFLNQVAARDFSAAWLALDKAYQVRRWPGGLRRFKDGYYYLRAVEEIQVVPRTVLQETAVIDAFFVEKKEVPIIPALNRWETVTFGEIEAQLPDLMSSLDKFLKEFAVSPTKLAKVKFGTIFHTDGPDAVRWELEITGTALSRKYRETQQHNFRVARRMYLNKTPAGNWLIERINWLST